MTAGQFVRVTALSLGVVIAVYAVTVRRERVESEENRDAELRVRLDLMRKAIDSFKRETGRHPATLQELVPKYLTEVPVDPITGSAATWRLTTEDVVQPNADFMKTDAPASASYIVNVHSGAGQPYSNF